MRYRLQRHDGTDCSATMVPITVLRMVPIQRYRQKFVDMLIYSFSRVWKNIRIFLKFLYECFSLLYKKRSKQEHVFGKRI